MSGLISIAWGILWAYPRAVSPCLGPPGAQVTMYEFVKFSLTTTNIDLKSQITMYEFINFF